MYKISVKEDNSLQAAIIASGLTALLVQIIFLREFLTVFYGNELVTGVIIGNWMLLTTAGAYTGRLLTKSGTTIKRIFTGLVINAFLPPLSLLALYLAMASFFPPGSYPGFLTTWFISIVVMMPFCVVSGALFTLFVKAYSDFLFKQKAPSVYAFEGAGSLLGGLLLTFVFIRFFSTFEILVFVSSICIAAAILLIMAYSKSGISVHYLLTALLVWVMFNVFVDLDRLSKTWIFKNEQIVYQEETPYGNLLITQAGEDVFFYENGINIFSAHNKLKNKRAVQLALLQQPAPARVLLLSGGVSGSADELYRYAVDTIDYVEINPALVENARRFPGFEERDNLQIHYADPRQYIRTTSARYNVVLLNMPPPSNAQLNRFYTVEFFQELKNVMAGDGVVTFSPGSAGDEPTPENLRLYSILAETLKEVFNHILIVRGQTDHFIASDMAISGDLINMTITADQHESLQAATTGEELMAQLDGQAPLNYDFKPVAYFARISYWLSWYGPGLRNVIVPVIAIIMVLVLALNTYNRGMFVAGFTASALEVMVFLAFQIVFGYVYQALALLIALFMGGLAAGAFLSQKISLKPSRKFFMINQLVIGLSAVMLPVMVFINGRFSSDDFVFSLFFYLIMAFSGILTGLHFSWASQLQKRDFSSSAAKAYGADLMGSAGGALLASVLLIPVLGLIWSGVFLLGLNVLVVFIALLRR
jgi:spermidine synthase